MPRIVLTGATGFVGGRLARRLRTRGDDVVALVRTPSDELAELGVEQVHGGFGALEETASDAGPIRDADAVAHVAASIDPDLEVAREVNRRATARVLEHAARAGARYVHVSTCSVYDLAAIGDAVVDETAPLVTTDADAQPTSSSAGAYAISKAEGEAEVVRAAADGLSAAILRPPAVLGAGPSSNWGTRVPSRLREGEWSPPHPSTTFGWVHVEDLVDAIVAAIDQPVDTTVNVVGGHTTFRAYVDAIRQVVPGVPELDAPAGDARRWNGSYAADRLPARLGVRPDRGFDDAMAEIGAWWTSSKAD